MNKETSPPVKLYMATQEIFYGGSDIIGVFDSKDKAKRACDARKSGIHLHLGNTAIVEVTLNEAED